MTSNSQYKTIHCRTKKMLNTQVQDLKSYLYENRKVIKYNLYEVGSDFISISFYENISFTKKAKLIEGLDFIVLILATRNIESKYDTSSELNFYDLNGEGVLMSSNEYIRLSSEIGQKISKEQLNQNSYLKGFIGSMIYSFPLVFVWILLEIYFELLSTGLAILVTIFGSLGYKKFNGKKNKWTKIVLISSNLVIIILANVLILILHFLQMNIPFNKMQAYFINNSEAQNVFGINLFISIIVSLVAWLWIIFDFIVKDNFIIEARKL